MVYATGCKCGKQMYDEGTCVWCGHGNADIVAHRTRSTLPEPVPDRRKRRTTVVSISAASRHAWTEESIVLAMRAWHRDTGKPPTSTAWSKSAPGRPTAQTVIRIFGSWTVGLEAAGFSRSDTRLPRAA